MEKIKEPKNIDRQELTNEKNNNEEENKNNDLITYI